MIAWLTDTLLYTGALIALVLVLRRPVTRHFGPQMSYALWALPLVRFVMPPVVLPASFAPKSESVNEMAMTTITLSNGVPATVVDAGLSAQLPVYYEPTFWDSWGGLIVNVALAAWIAGAVTFLAWRAWTYFRMRDWLLDGARPVGEAGSIRLVETAAVTSPVAFGVSDKVVALPLGFMAHENRAARDLAIEHELAHHRGRDLLANMLAQPILALHWFNPLAWMGWRAMRRDQEAACDARVIACRDPRERAVYGQVIASFAAGPRLALAAPMACPVLGEKSIIHRLRSLGMNDVSPRRRLMGRTLLAGAALALPFTASISYAEASASPHAADAAKISHAAPAITIVDVPEGADPNAKLHTRVVHKDGQTIILKTAKPVTDEEAQASIDRAQASMAGAPAFAGPTAAQREAIVRLRQSMTSEQWAKQNEQWAKFGEAWAKQGEQAAKNGESWAEWGEQYGKQWEDWGDKFGKSFAAQMPAAPPAPPAPAVPVVVNVQVPAYYGYFFSCDENGNLVKLKATPDNARAAAHAGRCAKVVDANANARRALLQAKARIQGDQGMDSDTRDQVIDSLDREIDRLDDAAEAKS